MAEIFIALGSNLGNREKNLSEACRRLGRDGRVEITDCSPIYETEPWGPVVQDWFLNRVCRARTELSPQTLMQWIREIEREGGRDRASEQRWGPRLIDIDLLAYDNLSYADELVEIPHPRLQERRFVLEPWADIAAEWRHPRLKITVSEMLDQVGDAGQVRRYRE